MTADRDELMNGVVDLALDLVLSHNTRPSDITKAISKRLQAEADSLPLLEVLYTDTYGGFQYSIEFEEYLTEQRKDAYHATSSPKILHMPADMSPFMTASEEVWRVYDCVHIRPYGKMQAKKYPIAFATVLRFYHLDMDTLERHVSTLAYAESDPKDRETAQSVCDKANLPKGLVEECCQQINIMSTRRTTDWYMEDRPRLDFQTFIDNKTEIDEELWRAQHHLHQEIMTALHKFQYDVDIYRSPGWEAYLEQAHKTFGLICASGLHCKLAIAHIPQIVEWKVGEYDGLERVCIT